MNVVNNIIRVVWICSVSNPELRSHLDLGIPLWQRIVNLLTRGKNQEEATDTAQWNTNAIEEFQQIEEVDLHVLFIHSRMKKNIQHFKIGRIHFYAISVGNIKLSNYLRRRFLGKSPSFNSVHKIIVKLVNQLAPDIIHIMGAENPPYSLAILKLPVNIPNIVQLQTLLSDPSVIKKQPELAIQISCEKTVLQNADYIGTKSRTFPKIIRENIKPDATCVNTRLVIGEKAHLDESEKQFDFVYFANFISKSVDLAIEAFGIAHSKHPSLTLDIIGGTSEEEVRKLMSRMEELGCKDAVTIEGKLPTHDDVIKQIRKARIALLPLKIDMVSGTVREAMWNGLPVITTITQGTPLLNEKRESVLLSEIGDHKALANNMIILSNDSALFERLQKNAVITVDELYGDNQGRAREWVEVYNACIDNFRNGTPLPESVRNNS